MSPASGPDPLTNPLAWVVGQLVRPARYVQILIGIAYLTALGGIGIAFVADTFDLTTLPGVVGIGLLAISFLTFFSLSMTLLGSGEA